MKVGNLKDSNILFEIKMFINFLPIFFTGEMDRSQHLTNDDRGVPEPNQDRDMENSIVPTILGKGEILQEKSNKLIF